MRKIKLSDNHYCEYRDSKTRNNQRVFSVVVAAASLMILLVSVSTTGCSKQSNSFTTGGPELSMNQPIAIPNAKCGSGEQSCL